jgi:hypothetical protein
MEGKLGDELYLVAFSVEGAITEKKTKDLVDEIIDKIGMEAAHEPQIFNYPVNGKGEGFVFIQTIITSFIGVDVWPDGAYLILCSCKPFKNSLIQKVFKEFGLKAKPCKVKKLSIKGE